MTLGFSQKINSWETKFVPKIWESLFTYGLYNRMNWSQYKDANKLGELGVSSFRSPNRLPKNHTIRRDPNNRWKKGMDIHFVINNRQKNRFQFAPILKCTKVEKIEIKWSEGDWIRGGKHKVMTIRIEDHPFCSINLILDNMGRSDYTHYKTCINLEGFEELCRNDGFDDPTQFMDYFNEDFTGNIIHWTNQFYIGRKTIEYKSPHMQA